MPCDEMIITSYADPWEEEAKVFRTNFQDIPSLPFDLRGLAAPVSEVLRSRQSWPVAMVGATDSVAIVGQFDIWELSNINQQTSFPMKASQVLISFFSPFSGLEQS